MALGFFKEFLQVETSLLCPFPQGTSSLVRARAERDEPSPFPPGEIRSIPWFCPGVIWNFGLSRVAGGEMGREERQTEHSLWMLQAGTACTLRTRDK